MKAKIIVRTSEVNINFAPGTLLPRNNLILATTISTKAAKVNSIAVLSGHGRKEDLLKLNPRYSIQDILELLEVEPLKKFLTN